MTTVPASMRAAMASRPGSSGQLALYVPTAPPSGPGIVLGHGPLSWIKEKAKEAKEKVEEKVEEAKEKAEEKAEEAKEKAEEAVDKVKEKVGEAKKKVQEKAEDTKDQVQEVGERVAQAVSEWLEERQDAIRDSGLRAFGDAELADRITAFYDEHTDGEFRDKLRDWFEEKTDGEVRDAIREWFNEGTRTDTGTPASDPNCVLPYEEDATFDDIVPATGGDCGMNLEECEHPPVRDGVEPWMVNSTWAELDELGWRLPRIVIKDQDGWYDRYHFWDQATGSFIESPWATNPPWQGLADLIAQAWVMAQDNNDVIEWVSCLVNPRKGATYRCLRTAFTGMNPTIRLEFSDDRNKGGVGQIWLHYGPNSPVGRMLSAFNSGSTPGRICAIISMVCMLFHEIGHASCLLVDVRDKNADDKNCNRKNIVATPALGWALAQRYYPWICNCCHTDFTVWDDGGPDEASTFDFWRYKGTWYPPGNAWDSC
jgi:vacuolar-type H+-ATPase subunit H